jgi:hypothetical protein
MRDDEWSRRQFGSAMGLVNLEVSFLFDSQEYGTADCGHVFLHPLTWMRPSLFPSEGAEASADTTYVSALASAPSDGKRLGRIQVRGWRKT